MFSYKNENHVSEILGTFISQFKDAQTSNPISPTLLQRIVTVFAEEIQNIEDVLCDIAWFQILMNATGAQLDDLGNIAGEPRADGESDTSYRNHILDRMVLNRSDGNIETFIEAVSMYGNVSHVEVSESTGIVYIYTDNDYAFDSRTLGMISSLASAGVRVHLSKTTSIPFVFKAAGSSDPAYGKGFGNVAGSIQGGTFAGLLI